MADLSGYMYRVRVNGTIYKAQKASWQPKGGQGPTTNCESGQFAERVPTILEAHVSVTRATFDPVLSPFNLPFNIQVGNYIDLKIYLMVIRAPVLIYSGIILVTGTPHEFDAENLQPITFEGDSHGPFYCLRTT